MVPPCLYGIAATNNDGSRARTVICDKACSDRGQELHDLNSVFVGILIISFVIGVWGWVSLLFRFGPPALLGYRQIVVHPFESIVVYRKGVFSCVLPPGIHWIWQKNSLLIKVDLRPEVFQIAQGTITSDRFPVALRCVARIQIKDPRAVTERAQNYRNEVHARLQSVAKTIGNQQTFGQLHANQEEFNTVARESATRAINDVGCECVGFELLQAESSSGLPDSESKKIGFGPH